MRQDLEPAQGRTECILGATSLRQNPDAFRSMLFCRGAEPVSLLEGFQDAFHERMCRKMQMAHAGPEKCAIESTVQVIVSVPTSGLTSSCTSIEFGKPDVFTGTVQSPSSWRGSMRRRSLGSGRDHSQDGKAVDVKICVREEARGSSPEIHLQGGLVQRPGRPECKQELSNEKVETPSTSVDDGGLPCVKIARSTPSGRGDRSTIIALGLRGDLFTQAAATCRLCMLGNNLEKHSGSPDRCECGCTAVAVIQDPFSASKRQLLTLDTALYLDWARSSNVVNDFRQATNDLGMLRQSPTSHLRRNLCSAFTRSRF